MARTVLNILRVEKSLAQRLRSCEPWPGRVLKSWERGFILIDQQDRPIYFFTQEPLHVPFGVAVEQASGRPVQALRVTKGCILARQGPMLCLSEDGGLVLNLAGGRLVDLSWQAQRISLDAPFTINCIRYLMKLIGLRGDWRGLAGVLNLLSDVVASPRQAALPTLPVSPYSAYAMQSMASLLRAGSERLPSCLREVSPVLIGCGPGLTPSGDDFLVGFFAAHYLGGSSLLAELRRQGWDRELAARAKRQTTVVSAELLACALQGKFSEHLIQACAAISGLCRDSRRDAALQDGPLERLLAWGSTSGTDTLTGLTLGIATQTSNLL